jgi:hypothetical protein
MGLDDDGNPPAGHTEEAEDNGDIGMDIEETTAKFLIILEKKSGGTSLQKEAARSARTGTSGTTTATGKKKIDEEDKETQEEEEDELKMKTFNWRKINLSFAVDLEGQDGEDIKDMEQQFKGDNDNKMKHHPIMWKIAKFMIAIEKKCNTVRS